MRKRTSDSTLLFDGQTSYVEIADSADFSVATTGQLSVSAWIRPDVLTFPAFQSTGYIHWMGKGAQGQQEWVFRMYNETTTDNPPRPNRISFYVFNPLGGEGIGSHFQGPVQAGEWIHVVGIADGATTSIYKDGVFRDCDRYTGSGSGSGPCHNYPSSLWVSQRTAPRRCGSEREISGVFFLAPYAK